MSALVEKIRDRESILSPEVLAAAMAELHARHRDGDALRPALLALLRQALADGRAEVRRRFELGGSGEDCIHQNAWVMDQVITRLTEFTATTVFPAPNPTRGEHFAVAAIGGYGRGELAPFSDVDLLFLLPYKRTPRVEQVVEYVLYLLWDLGLKVGHAVRSVDECIRQALTDTTVRTSLLESRCLCGAPELYAELRRRFAKEVVAGSGAQFIEAKLAERDERHRKLGDSRYVLEPNVKEGKGGLRDLQTLYWIAKYVHQVEDVAELVPRGVLLKEEATRFAKAAEFLWTVRCHLHYLAGRTEDRLTFDVQSEISRRLDYRDHAGASGVERFMKHYFLVAKDVGDLTRIFCANLEADQQRPPRFSFLRFARLRKEIEGFALEGERLNVASERHFLDHPADLIRLFHVAQHHDLDIHPNALRAVTRALGAIGPRLREDPEANRLFLEILTSRRDPELALRRMNEAGVLGRFVPDFGRVVAQMQYDMYHVYTVDEHTLFAIGILHRIETGQLADQLPLACEVVSKLVSRRALYCAMLLHDIAKGRGGDHSVLGAKIAQRLCPRLGLTAEETETVCWLVRWHLAMSDTALKRDLEDEKTVRDFVELVQSPERLRLLLVLTTADIRAVGPGRWNGWKATLLAELYHRAEDLMQGVLQADRRERRVAAAQNALRPLLPDWREEEIEAHFSRGYPAYWLGFDAETHAYHARLIRAAERGRSPLTVDTRIDRKRGVTEVTIYTDDHPGLFSRLAGAFAVSGATIVDAKIFTTTDGMALDVFTVQNATGGPFDSGDKLAKLSVMVERTLSGQLRPLLELAKKPPVLGTRSRAFRVPPRVLIDNKASSTHTVIEINAKDRPGLLYDVTRALTSLSLQISTAKISTYGEKAIDVFYVKDVFGLKVMHDNKLAQIRDKLLAALQDAADAQAAEPPRPAAHAGLRRRRASARRRGEAAE
ncbi:[protein-PII] uridylyltransferase [Arenibaculum pallidiluteum]|uniref:[protein-PII] uridylyltransferase n=1 Tax=Arenibaculum pallidiluteum TaxID=2812559 RepID=UPI001F3379CA|nr:[protein-PII] uridylyltransferase [Arenibaculum pallidiluteum]